VPAFYSRESDFNAGDRIDEAAGVVAVMRVRREQPEAQRDVVRRRVRL
jgi:pseudouridine-5'-phosphate glycosidase